MKKQKLFEFNNLFDEKEFNSSILSGLVVGMITTLTQGIYYWLKGDDIIGERVFMYGTAIIIILIIYFWKSFVKSRDAVDEISK